MTCGRCAAGTVGLCAEDAAPGVTRRPAAHPARNPGPLCCLIVWLPKQWQSGALCQASFFIADLLFGWQAGLLTSLHSWPAD